MLLLGFVLVFVTPTPQAHAAGTINSAVTGWTNSATGTVGLTVGHTFDILAIGVQIIDNTASGTNADNVTSVTDSLGNAWTLLGRTAGIINQVLPGGSCSVHTCIDDEVWYTLSPFSGSDSIVVSFQTSTTQGNIQAVDILGGTRPTQPYQIQYCAASVSCTSTMNFNTAGSTPSQAGDMPFASIMSACEAASTLTPGTGFSLVGSHSPYDGDSMYALNTNTAYVTPTDFPSSCSGSQGTWAVIGVNFPSCTVAGCGQVTVTTTKTASTGTSTQGGGTISGSSQYINSDTMYWNPGQNLIGATATITNVTAKLSAVHIASATASVYLVAYAVSPANFGIPPSSSAPLENVYAHQFTVTNGSGAQLLSISVPSSVTVCGYCYYAIAIQTNGNHSNSASVTDSGVDVNEATSAVGTWYQFTVGGNVIPNSIYFGTAAPNALYVHMGLSWPVAIVTATVSTTSTVYSAVSTYTSTSIENQAGIQTNVDLYLALAIIGGLFLIMAKVGGIAGAMFGAIVGEIICIVGGIITGDLADVALVATMLGCAAMIYMGRSPGGGGGV